MGFVCSMLDSGRVNHGINWKGLYFDVAAELGDRDGSMHLRNRRRIWQSLRHFTDCLIPLLEQEPVLLYPTLEIVHFHRLLSDLQSHGYGLGNAVHRHLPFIARTVEQVKEDILYSLPASSANCILFESLDALPEPFEVRVSFVTFNCTRFVAGLRLIKQDGDKEKTGTELCRAGLIFPSSESTLKTSNLGRLSGIRVASSNIGLVGIAFLFFRWSDGEDSVLWRSPRPSPKHGNCYFETTIWAPGNRTCHGV